MSSCRRRDRREIIDCTRRSRPLSFAPTASEHGWSTHPGELRRSGSLPGLATCPPRQGGAVEEKACSTWPAEGAPRPGPRVDRPRRLPGISGHRRRALPRAHRRAGLPAADFAGDARADAHAKSPSGLDRSHALRSPSPPRASPSRCRPGVVIASAGPLPTCRQGRIVVPCPSSVRVWAWRWRASCRRA